MSKEVLEEIIEMSVRVINLCRKTSLPLSIKDQVIRSATSIGANFSEAQDASSKRDFINKIYIAKKEASETSYWLTLIAKINKNSEEEALILADRSHRFVMMLQKIINTSKGSNRKPLIDNPSKTGN